MNINVGDRFFWTLIDKEIECEVCNLSKNNRFEAFDIVTKEKYVFNDDRKIQVKIESYREKKKIKIYTKAKLEEKLTACLYNFDRRYMFMKMVYPDRIKFINLEGNSQNVSFNIIDLLEKNNYDLNDLGRHLDNLFPEVIV